MHHYTQLYLQTVVARLQFRLQRLNAKLVISGVVAQVAVDLGKVRGQVVDLLFQLACFLLECCPLLLVTAS